MLDTSFSSCMPLVPFKLLPQGWSLGVVSLNKFVCGFVKRNCLGLQNFLLLTQSPLVFAARTYGDLSSWHWNPGLRGLVWGWDFLLLRYPSQIFIHHMWMWDQPVSCLPPTSLDGCGFFNSVVVRLPFNSICDGYESWLFYILVVILMWLCEEASCVYLSHHLDWKSMDLIVKQL